MRRIALHGSYFGYNFGDTLLCALFCSWIKAAPNAEVVLPLASRRNKQLIGADSRGLIAFLSCPELVFCGGGYFGGPARKSFKWTVRNFLRHFVVAEIAMLMRKKVYILGTGVGPVPTVLLRRRLKKLADYAERIIVRDEESRTFLESLGVDRPIDVDVDAAMYMNREFFESPVECGRRPVFPRGTDRTVAIHLTNFDAPYWEEMAQVVTRFCQDSPGIRTLLITDSLTRTKKRSAQDRSTQQLAELLPGARRIDYDGNPTQLCRVLDTVDLVVTNKLHVGIVSVVLGKDVVSLPQHVKTPRFYRQLEMSEVCVTENHAQRLEALLHLWSDGRLPRAKLSSRPNCYLEALHAVGVAS